MSKRCKFVFVTWVGPSVSVMKKAKMSTDKALMKDIIQVLHVIIFTVIKNAMYCALAIMEIELGFYASRVVVFVTLRYVKKKPLYTIIELRPYEHG